MEFSGNLYLKKTKQTKKELCDMYHFSLNKPETALFKIRNKIKKNKPCDIGYRGSNKESDQENYQDSRLNQMAKYFRRKSSRTG